MEGIEILAREQVFSKPGWPFMILIAGIFLSILWASSGGFGVIEHSLIAFITVSIVFLLMIVVGGIFSVASDERYEYDKLYVRVTDKVDIAEFEDRYKIIEKHGDLWELKEIGDPFYIEPMRNNKSDTNQNVYSDGRD